MLKKSNLINEDLLKEFMIYCQQKHLGTKTMMSYEATLKLFFRYLEDSFNVTNVNGITESMCNEYISFTRKRGKYTFVSNDNTKHTNIPESRRDFGKNISIATMNNYIRNLKVFFNFLIKENIHKQNTMRKIKLIKNERISIDQLTDDEFARIIKSLDLTKFSEYRDYIIIHLIIDTGMHVGECLNLELKSVNLERRAIFIPGEIARGKKDRYVFFSNTMGTMLRRWINYKDRYVDSDYLFCVKRGTIVGIGNFETNFAKYITRARITKSISPHVLRNNFGRRYLLAGGSIYDLSIILGHSSVTVTEKAYADVLVEDVRKNYQHFSPLENMRKGGRR